MLLITSGVLEAVWAHALGNISGLDSTAFVFAGALIASTIGLALAMRHVPTAVAYAVWTGIGASLAVVWGMAAGDEPVSPLRVGFLVLLVGCVAGLHAQPETTEKSDGASAG
ncbi:MAG: SMR family transporter [Latilactobacillus curvatus]